jgi:hypothetical protein
MGYEKQNFRDGETIFASQLEQIEDGVLEAVSFTAQTLTPEQQAQARKNLGLPSPAKIGTITLLASGWVGAESPYSQIVSLEGVTENSQVDLTPSVQQLAVFHGKDLAFVTENDGGVVTVYAIGQKPAHTYTIQVTITEVLV